jgi:prepilin-type processing-associated H-X9-DG protein
MVKISHLLCPSDGNSSIWRAGETIPTNYIASRAEFATSFIGSTTSTTQSTPRSWLRIGPKVCVTADTAHPDGFFPIIGGCLTDMTAITDGTSNSIAFSEGVVYDRSTSTNGGNYKYRLVVNGIGHYGHNAQTCLNAKQGMLDGTQTSYYYTGWGHNVRVRAFDWYPFICVFQTLLPPNSPSCTNGTNTEWATEAVMSATSNHSGGVNVSLLDGSVRFITNSIETKNLNRISTSRDYPTDSTGTFSFGVWSELGSINGGESTTL